MVPKINETEKQKTVLSQKNKLYIMYNMMKKFLFMIQISFLFNEQDQKTFIHEKKNQTREKKIIKQDLKNNIEYKIAVGIIIIILLVVLCFKNKEINKEKGQKEEQKRQKEQAERAAQEAPEKEDFDFLKTFNLRGDCKRKNKIFKNYEQKEPCSGLYIVYKEDQADFFIVKFVTALDSCYTLRFDVHNKKNKPEGVPYDFLTKILDFEKFEQKYRKKVLTEEMLKDYVYGPENQPN